MVTEIVVGLGVLVVLGVLFMTFALMKAAGMSSRLEEQREYEEWVRRLKVEQDDGNDSS